MNDMQVIENMISAYFSGLHQGDADRLADLFHADCVLKSPERRITLAQWLQNVRQRPVPQQQGHLWRYQIIDIDIQGQQAMVKLHCPLPHGDFVYFLGLLKEQQQWRIVNKMYAINEEH